MQIIDLSHRVEDGMQVFPGDPQVSTRRAASVGADGFQVTELHLGSHSGTHVDAPSHTVDGGDPIDTLDLTALFGPARIVDVTGVEAHQTIDWGDVATQLTGITPGTIVLFNTGWDKYFNSQRYLEHPVLDVEVASRLTASGVNVIGLDTLNPDRTPMPDTSEPISLPVHGVILGNGGAIVENLTNLGAVPWGAPIFSALPLRLSGHDGSPVRAVAFQQ